MWYVSPYGLPKFAALYGSIWMEFPSGPKQHWQPLRLERRHRKLTHWPGTWHGNDSPECCNAGTVWRSQIDAGNAENSRSSPLKHCNLLSAAELSKNRVPADLYVRLQGVRHNSDLSHTRATNSANATQSSWFPCSTSIGAVCWHHSRGWEDSRYQLRKFP